MKKLHFSPYCILLIVGNCFAAVLLTDIAEAVRETYQHLAVGAPGLTMIMVGFPRWFWALGALSFLAGIGVFARRVPVPALVHLLLIIALLDVIALFFFAFGIGLYFIPSMDKVGL